MPGVPGNASGRSSHQKYNGYGSYEKGLTGLSRVGRRRHVISLGHDTESQIQRAMRTNERVETAAANGLGAVAGLLVL